MFGIFRADKDKVEVLLPGYEHFTHLVGTLLLVLFIVLTLLLPDKYIAFVSDRMMLIYALLPTLIASVVIFGFMKLEEQKKYFLLIDLTWTGSFFVVVYLTVVYIARLSSSLSSHCLPQPIPSTLGGLCAQRPSSRCCTSL